MQRPQLTILRFPHPANTRHEILSLNLDTELFWIHSLCYSFQYILRLDIVKVTYLKRASTTYPLEWMEYLLYMWTWACRRERNMCSKKRLRKRIPHLIVLGCTSSFFADYGRRGGNKYDREHDTYTNETCV